MKTKPTSLGSGSSAEKVPEWYVNDDFEAADHIVKTYGIDGTGIPDESDIRTRAERHRHRERQIDLDASGWVFKRFLEANRDGEVTTLIKDAFRKRAGKREYKTRAPFSALLIAHFGYNSHRASKIAVYLRAALHKDWSIPKLRHEMKARWYIKRSSEEAQKYLQEKGEIKKRAKSSSNEKNAIGENKSDAKGGIPGRGGADFEDQIKDDPLEDEADLIDIVGDLGVDRVPGRKSNRMEIRLAVPPSIANCLSKGKSIYPKLTLSKNGEIIATHWYTLRELQERLGRSGAAREKVRSSAPGWKTWS